MKLPHHIKEEAIGLPIPESATSEPVRVLLIDDDDDEATLTRSLLARIQDIQYKVDWVSTFREGLAAIAREEHDAYLIDQNLGGLTGVELVQAARKAGSLAALIMLTGQRDRVTDMAAMEAGATDFLLKGQTDAALLDRTLRYAITQASIVSGLDRSRNQLAGLVRISGSSSPRD
jgi:DNA-binding response OmpR family regulator